MFGKEISLAMLSVEIKKRKPSLIKVTYYNSFDYITKIFFDNECFWEGNFVYTGGKAVMNDEAYYAIVDFLSRNYHVVEKNIFSTNRVEDNS